MDEVEKQLDSIRKLQLAELDIIKVFIEICKKENLRYFAAGGTLLGAVRHKGFIPWDDDVDIVMPRKDYNTFLKVANKYLSDDYKLLCDDTDSDYLYFIPRLTCKKYKVRNSLYKTQTIDDVSIDIFALDGVPVSKMLQAVYVGKILALRALYKFSVLDRYVAIENPNRTWYEKALIFICKRFYLQRVFSPRKRLDAFKRAQQKYSFESSKYVGCLMGAYKMREIFQKEVFGTGAEQDFEDIRIVGPERYDIYLKQFYGDYMIPPEQPPLGKHKFELIISDNSTN